MRLRLRRLASVGRRRESPPRSTRQRFEIRGSKKFEARKSDSPAVAPPADSRFARPPVPSSVVPQRRARRRPPRANQDGRPPAAADSSPASPAPMLPLRAPVAIRSRTDGTRSGRPPACETTRWHQAENGKPSVDPLSVSLLVVGMYAEHMFPSGYRAASLGEMRLAAVLSRRLASPRRATTRWDGRRPSKRNRPQRIPRSLSSLRKAMPRKQSRRKACPTVSGVPRAQGGEPVEARDDR